MQIRERIEHITMLACDSGFKLSSLDSATIQSPAFCVAAVWKSCELISSGGFGLLLENDIDLDAIADVYAKIGFSEFKALLEEAQNVRQEESGNWYETMRSIDRRFFALTAGDRLVSLLEPLAILVDNKS